jgi:hypothetical protein
MFGLFTQIKKWGPKVGAKVMFDYSLGKGFFLLKSDGPTIVKKLLILTPYKTSWGLGIFQEWVPSLNLSYPKGMQMHTSTWITLWKLLVEFQNVGGDIAAGLDIVLKFNKQITQIIKQRFCMALKAKDEWEILVVVENEAAGDVVIMLIGQSGVDFVWKFFTKLKIALL